MLSVISNSDHKDRRPAATELLSAMWQDRKRVFVDTLGWDVPVVDNVFEIDQFDNEHAVYMVVSDQSRSRHLASVRLLPSNRAHILGDIFPQLCAGPVPRGEDVWEITRLCMSPAISPLRQAMMLRRELALGLVEYALANGIRRFTQVHLASHLPQLLAVGWDCEPIGFPMEIEGQMLSASRIDITPATLDRLRTGAGLTRPMLVQSPLALAA